MTKVAIVIEVLKIDVVEYLRVLGVIYITRLKMLIINDVCIIVPVINFVCGWFQNHFFIRALTLFMMTMVAPAVTLVTAPVEAPMVAPPVVVATLQGIAPRLHLVTVNS